MRLPSWITGAVSGRWGEIPGGTLADVDPDPGRTAAWAGSGGQAEIVNAWGSMWTDPLTGRQWRWGGGHSNYRGNELYYRDLLVASPAWVRVNEPSDLGEPWATTYGHGVGTATTYSDGRIRSSHAFNAFVWVPGIGPVMAGLSSRATDGGNGSMALVTFNTSTGAATFSSTATSSGNGTPVAACYDSTRGASGSIWIRRTGTSFMLRHDIAADTRTTVGAQKAFSAECSLAYHPDDWILLGSEGDGGSGGPDWSGSAKFCVFDCATGSYYFPTFSGTVSGGLQAGTCQPIWVPEEGKFCAWDNDTDRTLITTLTPGADPFSDPWTISALTVDVGNTVTPSAAPAAGTYGQFNYIPAAGIFTMCATATHPGYFYKR